MRKEVRHICRRLLRKFRPVLPLLLVSLVFIYIIREEITAPAHFTTSRWRAFKIWEGNSSLQLQKQIKVVATLAVPAVSPTSINNAHYAIQGEIRAAHVRDVCQHVHTSLKDITLTGRWSKDNSLFLCPIYKVGTTFWRRVFMIQGEQKYKGLVNPYEIPFDKDYPASKVAWKGNISYPAYMVMFTRDPYLRLFSFFIDKILAPNPYFWKSVGVKVAQLTRHSGTGKNMCGNDITFPEFIKYVIHTLETRKDIDPHWVEMETNCHPCEMNYDFIGKMERFQNDSKYILRKLGLTKMLAFLETSGSDAASNDAIRDTLSQPFTFRPKYRSCMNFKDAVSRAWKKLQIRGLIGNETLNGIVIDEKTTKFSDLISRANASRNSSTSVYRKQVKNRSFSELWSRVSIADLYKLKQLYASDFELFGYDAMPSALFQRQNA